MFGLLLLVGIMSSFGDGYSLLRLVGIPFLLLFGYLWFLGQ